MYKISKRIEVSGSHRLELDYDSKCEELHGHNWIIIIHCRAEELNEDGMIIDFTEIKKKVKKKLDHKNLNDVLDFNPTAENIARWVVEQLDECYKAEVQESEGNIAVYEIKS